MSLAICKDVYRKNIKTGKNWQPKDLVFVKNCTVCSSKNKKMIQQQPSKNEKLKFQNDFLEKNKQKLFKGGKFSGTSIFLGTDAMIRTCTGIRNKCIFKKLFEYL